MDLGGSMNQTLQLINWRRSLRSYSDRPITDSEKSLILQAAMRAPTAGNMMLYTILEVADPEKKRRLAQTCDHQPFIAKAPLVLIFLADLQRWQDYYALCGVREYCNEHGLDYAEPAEADLLLACCDALIAAQNAVIAAESLGIGSCYIGDVMENYEIHRAMFSLPRLTFPVTMLCFGHYRQLPDGPSTVPRFTREAIHGVDRYPRLARPELARIFDERYSRQFAQERFMADAANPGQHHYLKKTAAPFAVEMRRSVRAALASWCGGGSEEPGDQPENTGGQIV